MESLIEPYGFKDAPTESNKNFNFNQKHSSEVTGGESCKIKGGDFDLNYPL